MAEAEKIRILIVDDIADTRDNLAKLIGFEPDMEVAGTADGGQAAVNLAKKERPHVILMDINMPDMDGITATEIISNTVPESPIIMMSVQGEQDYLRRSMLAGAREFLVKPFSADELINAIRHVHELEKVKRARYAAAAPAAVAQVNPLTPAGGVRVSGQIITFFSPKGGVGRTTIATNLAVALHQLTQKPVCLVDGSLPFGEIAEKLGYGSDKVQLVANRNDSSGGIKASDVEASLGRKIPHTIVSDGRTLVLAVNRGVPFVISHRESQVAKDIFTLAQRISAEAPEAAAAGAAKPAARAGGMRLFAR